MGCNTLGVLQPSMTGQPGQPHFELSGLYVQVRATAGQPDISQRASIRPGQSVRVRSC